MSASPAIAYAFHCEIWFGWTPNFIVISWIVDSSHNASSVTFALKSLLNVCRFFAMCKTPCFFIGCLYFKSAPFSVLFYALILIIAVIKIINIISGFVKKKKFTAVHSLANKVTGAVLFLLPLTLTVFDIRYSSIPVCMIASFAAIQEGFFIFRCSSASGNEENF